MSAPTDLIEAGLRALGIERLVLAIHDVSFPSAASEDIGRGSPYGQGGHELLRFARELGFDGIQLGPQGQTAPGNPSPYDGSVFSRSILSIALAELATARFAHLVDAETIAAAVAAKPAGDARAHYRYAFAVQQRILAAASATLHARAACGDAQALALTEQVAAFAARSPWLAHDARFEAFAAANGTDDWQTWPLADQLPDPARIAEVEREQHAVIQAHALGQHILDVQHGTFREKLRALGLSAYGDLQVGLSPGDRWCRGHLFLQGYLMGAPPSRTNPEGQPWGYPVLDPAQYLTRFVGDAIVPPPLAFVRARINKMFAELDGLRIDHPHGLVCPWVYDAAAADPMEAVVHGARLFETPASKEHPRLAAFALVREDQLDQSVPAFDDDHVRDLSPQQVDEYARLFDVVMKAAREAGRSERDVLCEILSTCPAPLETVRERFGLGRFRVTQKASLTDAADGYRGENAEPRDWIMVGTHDTEPLLGVLERWVRAGTVAARAEYLASRLEPEPSRRAALASALASDPSKLVQAMFAELFVGPASNVLVFFADLFGERARYNRPGVVSEDNWVMRVPRAFREVYAERCASGEALDLPGAVALAMRARGAAFVAANAVLMAALEASAVLPLP